MKLKEKKAEYEAIASTDSSVNLENIDNRIITEVLGHKRYGRVQFQGSGVTPTQYFGSGSQQYMPSGSQAQAEVQRGSREVGSCSNEAGSGSSEGGRGSSDGSRAEQKVRWAPVTTSA
ncbi:50S ribosomal L1P [Gossypium arboreum]|uniref:50S ribosomal L1P n=1 Tax=Gossypium arboreum TaxID=29729 RepID=A0A0B0N9B7_GOSAR|nr:50S ribosomal L1P [Gossypium arboreum]